MANLPHKVEAQGTLALATLTHQHTYTHHLAAKKTDRLETLSSFLLLLL